MKDHVPGHRPIGMADVAAKSEVEQELQEELALDFSPEELHEFLAADLVEVPADPAFRERLRDKLLALVRDRYGSPGAVARRPRSKS